MDRVLLDLFQRQVHHRGQAPAMLGGTFVRPPQLDEFFLADEAALRAAEFAQLDGPKNGSGMVVAREGMRAILYSRNPCELDPPQRPNRLILPHAKIFPTKE